MQPSIRPIETRDRARWEPLWDGYTRFYEREPRDPFVRYSITRTT